MSEMTRMDEENDGLRREIERLTRELTSYRQMVQDVATEITATAIDYRLKWQAAVAELEALKASIAKEDQ